jgi:hypothetical protein
MKLNIFLSHRRNAQLVQCFGAGQLVRNADGTHDLIGGTTDDIRAAKEWVSMFAHDIAFSAAPGVKTVNCRPQRKETSPRIRFAW